MGGSITGPWRWPATTSAGEKGGIHDDDTTQELGFQGGTIAGSIHMGHSNQAPCMLLSD